MTHILIAAAGVFATFALLFGYLLAKRTDELAELRNRATFLIRAVTNGRVSDPLAPFSQMVEGIEKAANTLRQTGERIASRSLAADPTNGMTETELAVLRAMSNGESVLPLSGIASETCLSEATVRLVVQWLKLRGLVELGQLRDEDTDEVRGRGYYLTKAGVEAQERAYRKPSTNPALAKA